MYTDSNNKRRRCNNSEAGIASGSEIPQDFENTSGKIVKVTLVNFLNHAHLTFNCSPHLNLIFGRNGQGKSAIVQGIALCLGATGHSVGRDASLNHYIKDYHLKNGPNSAKIEIYISNHGPGSYKPELYGDLIILSRTIYKNGSTYYLGGSLLKKAPVDRKTLNQYLRHIKINNPTTYMDQEMCKSFFFQSSSHSFYKYYSSCAGLDKMEEKINSEKKNLEDCKAELRIRKRVLEPDQQKLENLSKQIVSFEEKLNEWKSAKESYKLALYRESKENYELCKAKYEKYQNNDPNEKIKLKEDSIADLNQQLTNLKNEINELVTTSMDLKEKIRTSSDSISLCEDHIKELKSSMISLDSNISQVEEDLKRFEDKPAEINVKSEYDDLKRKLELTNAEYEELHQQHQTLMSDLITFENSNNDLQYQMKQVNADLDDLKKDLEIIKTNDVKTSESSRLGLYKYNLNSVKESIKRAKNSSTFTFEPIGPVGDYLRVVPNVPSWKVLPIIERHLKKFLFNWVVYTEQDRVTLEKILIDNGCDANNVKITKTNLFNRKIDVIKRTEREIEQVGFNSLIYNFLQVKQIPSVLLSILIDSFNISKTAICKDEKEMISVLKDERMNITAAYTINNLDFGKRVNGALFLTPSYDKNPYHYRFVRYSNDEQLDLNAELQKRLSDFKLRETELKKYYKELSSKFSDNSKKINSVKSKLNSIQKKKTELFSTKTKMEYELNTRLEFDQVLQNTDSDEVLKLKKNYTNQLESLNKQMSDFEDKLDAVLKEKKAHESSMRELHSSLESILAEISSKKMQSNKTQSSINSGKVEIKNLLRESVNYNSTLSDLQSSMKEALKQVNNTESDLKESGIDYSGPLPPKKSQDYLKIVNANREILSSLVDSSKNVENYLDNLKQKYQEAQDSFKDKQAKLAETESNYSRQKANYTNRIKLFDEYRLRMEKLAKAVFKSTLDSVCGYDGSLIFNDVNRTLDVHIHNKQQSYERAHVARDLKTLSGGEQSSIQLSMIHSLASLSFSPLHMFDEIDVYMDESTRIKNVNAIVDFADHNRNRQFFLLTPHMEFARHVSESHPDITRLFNVSKS